MIDLSNVHCYVFWLFLLTMSNIRCLTGQGLGLTCYYCTRLTVLDAGSQEMGAVTAVLDAAIGGGNEQKCKERVSIL